MYSNGIHPEVSSFKFLRPYAVSPSPGSGLQSSATWPKRQLFFQYLSNEPMTILARSHGPGSHNEIMNVQ